MRSLRIRRKKSGTLPRGAKPPGAGSRPSSFCLPTQAKLGPLSILIPHAAAGASFRARAGSAGPRGVGPSRRTAARCWGLLATTQEGKMCQNGFDGNFEPLSPAPRATRGGRALSVVGGYL